MIPKLRILAIFSAIVVASPLAAPGQAEAVDKTKWQLLWSDEFEGDELDATKWSRCQRGSPDWQNTMSDDPRLLQVDEGILRLRGIENDDTKADASPYLTAGVTSEGKFSFQHGKVVVRARFKSAQGAWPAIWMLGEKGDWPANGEIDLMEHLNFDNKVYQTAHSEYTQRVGIDGEPKQGATAEAERDKWNTYGCEWDADQIVWTINGKPTHRYPRVEELGAEQWPFDQEFYFILSMQVGGGWVNQSGPTDPTHYPAHLEVDWIRVYQPAVRQK